MRAAFARTNGVDPQSVKGFLAPEEGTALAEAARQAGTLGPVLEIGSYCGRSALYLAPAARAAQSVLFCLDHHRGSEENQPGQAWHDAALADAQTGGIDSLPAFRCNIARAGLEDCVIALVGDSASLAQHWITPLGMVFIDGGHTMKAALADYRGWATKLVTGGVLAIHDVFPNPQDGGRPPFEIYQMALASGLFAPLRLVQSLVLLRRLG